MEKGTKESCSCDECKSYCQQYPGWMTPEEAQKAIEAGKSGQLMIDWWEGSSETNYENVYVLIPASSGYEASYAPECPSILHGGMFWRGPGRCVFLDKEGKCGIHDSGFKPWMCRDALHGENESVDKLTIAKLWDTPQAKELLETWRKEHDVGERGDYE